MLAALSQHMEQTRERLLALSVTVSDRIAPALAIGLDVYALVMPYALKAFHYGFVPFVLVLGMTSTTPRPKLTDLLTPM